MHGCWTGESEIVTILLNNGAAVTEVDKLGETALFYILDGHLESKSNLITMLVDKGCDVNRQNNDQV